MDKLELDNANKLKAYFHSTNGIKIRDDWILGCVQYFMGLEPDITIQNLINKAMYQWTLVDLRTFGLNRLPDALFEEHKDVYLLTGEHPLQMQYILDISESCYDQYRRLHNQKLDETDEEMKQRQNQNIKKKRMFKLELTDGNQTIEAIEHKPIACLNSKLPPGTKVLIKGPVKVTNKILFLESQNISIYGGEVDSLLIENAYENILLKQLNKPITETPNVDYEEPPIEEEVKRPPQVLREIPMPQTVKPKIEERKDSPPKSKTNKPKPQATNNKKPLYPSLEDDDVFAGIDLAAFEKQAKEKAGITELKSEATIETIDQKSKKPITVIETICIDDEDDDIDMSDIFAEMDQMTKNKAINNVAKPLTCQELNDKNSYKGNNPIKMESTTPMDIDYDLDFDELEKPQIETSSIKPSYTDQNSDSEPTICPINRYQEIDFKDFDYSRATSKDSLPSTSKYVDYSRPSTSKDYENFQPSTSKDFKYSHPSISADFDCSSPVTSKTKIKEPTLTKTLTQYGFGNPTKSSNMTGTTPKTPKDILSKPSSSYKSVAPFILSLNRTPVNKVVDKTITEKSKTLKAKPNSPAYLDDDEDYEEEVAKPIAKKLIEVEKTNQPEQKKDLDFTTEELPPKIPKLTLNFDFSKVFDNDFEDLPPPSTIDSKKFLDKNYKYNLEGSSIVTIDQLSTLDEQEKIGRSFVVFCYMSGITDKLKIGKDENWSFGALISDSPSELNFLMVQFGDATLSAITGLTGKEMVAMREESRGKPEIRQIMGSSFKKLEYFFKNQRKFYLQIEYQQGKEKAFATKIYNPTPEINDIMRKKVEREFIKNNIFKH